MTIRDLITGAASRLKRARIPEPRLEAESLLAHLLRRDLAWLIAQVRSLTVEHAEIDTESARFIRFKSWDWVRVDGIPATVRAAQIRFEVRYILDSPDTPTTATLTAASGLLLTLDGDDYLNVSNGDGTILKRLRLLARA